MGKVFQYMRKQDKCLILDMLHGKYCFSIEGQYSAAGALAGLCAGALGKKYFTAVGSSFCIVSGLMVLLHCEIQYFFLSGFT